MKDWRLAVQVELDFDFCHVDFRKCFLDGLSIRNSITSDTTNLGMSRGQGTTANNNQQENNNFLLACGGSTTIVIDFSNNTALLLSVAMQLLAMLLCVGVDVCSGDALGSLYSLMM